MKLDVAVNEAVLANVGATGEFKIRNSAKAFKILSDGLYSNKIRAIIRELACNALDSHVAAGKSDVPFEVHLPTLFEPWFSVTDFGIGLSGDQVTQIYTTYFESTKTDSNDYIGALGLGSKSPFSYTENFTVIAIKDGYKRIYSAYINESGIPCIAEMSEELTDEGNGVEVKFSVTERHDFGRFRDEARQVFRWFKDKPKITGIDSFEHISVSYKELNIVPGVHMADNTHGSFAVMGNIAYPINNVPGADKHFGDLAFLLENNIVMEFAIGEVDFAASREELSYVPLTMNSIKKKLDALNANLVIHLKAKADAIVHPWDRAIFLQEEYRNRIFKSAVLKYVSDTKFELFEVDRYQGNKVFRKTVAELNNMGVTCDSFSIGSNSCSKISPTHYSVAGNYQQGWEFPVIKETVFILNDLKTRCVSRARYHYLQTVSNAYGTRVYCISHESPELDIRQQAYDTLMKEFHNPPRIIKASELNKKPSVVRTAASLGITEITLKQEKRAGYADSYTWVPAKEKFNDDDIYYFVALKNHTTLQQDGLKPEPDFFATKALMDECGIPAISKIKIYGVRKSKLAEISELDNWVWYEDKLKEETAKISDEHVTSLVVSKMLDSYYSKVHTNADVAKKLPATSLYSVFVETYMKIKRATGNISQLVTLCGKYGKSVKVDDVKNKISTAKGELYARYPLLKHIGDAEVDDVVGYVKMVDNQEKI